jgi:membrane-bound metal-dependent hydrolase YbcI (DUF457 family)
LDIIFHMLIPAMLAIIAGLGKKKALLLAPVAVVPDLDAAFSAHRMYLHSIFIPVFIAVVAYVFARRKSWKLQGQMVFFASLFYLSHLFLDFFGGAVGLLWPITNWGYGLSVSLQVTQQGIIPLALVDVHFISQQIPIPNAIVDVLAASPQSVAVALLFFFVLAVPKLRRFKPY